MTLNPLETGRQPSLARNQDADLVTKSLNCCADRIPEPLHCCAYSLSWRENDGSKSLDEPGRARAVALE